jgi:hypothetical protein
VRAKRKDPLGDFDRFPADAQLCIISLSWASGAESRFPEFCKATRAMDWFRAAKHCGFANKGNKKLQRRPVSDVSKVQRPDVEILQPIHVREYT